MGQSSRGQTSSAPIVKPANKSKTHFGREAGRKRSRRAPVAPWGARPNGFVRRTPLEVLLTAGQLQGCPLQELWNTAEIRCSDAASYLAHPKVKTHFEGLGHGQWKK